MVAKRMPNRTLRPELRDGVLEAAFNALYGSVALPARVEAYRGTVEVTRVMRVARSVEAEARSVAKTLRHPPEKGARQ